MPYFKEKNILFIHIPKNAGMYIEKQLGIPSSIISSQTPTDKPKISSRILHFSKKLRNIILDISDNQQLEIEYLHGQFGGPYAYQHASLSEIISYRMLPEEELENSIILAVHRNPIDRLVSIYKYWGYYKILSFDEFCIKIVANPQNALDNFGLLMHLKTQVSYINDSINYSNKIEWLSFENLDSDLKEFMRKNNLKTKIDKNKKNESIKKSIEVSKESLSIIRNVYKEDFVHFGYNI